MLPQSLENRFRVEYANPAAKKRQRGFDSPELSGGQPPHGGVFLSVCMALLDIINVTGRAGGACPCRFPDNRSVNLHGTGHPLLTEVASGIKPIRSLAMCANNATGAPSRALLSSSPHLQTNLVSIRKNGVERHFCKLAATTVDALMAVLNSLPDGMACSASSHVALTTKGGVA